MQAQSEFDPIFVHASMRSGSTYFFNVLRRNAALMCFNEVVMDGKRAYARFKKPRTRPDRSCQEGRQMGGSKRSERSIIQRARI
jgi:hypothetical protein